MARAGTRARSQGAKRKSKSRVNEAGNYTKPTMRKNLFNRIKAGGKGGAPGQWSARKAQMLAKQYKAKGGGYRLRVYLTIPEKAKSGKETHTKCQTDNCIRISLMERLANGCFISKN